MTLREERVEFTSKLLQLLEWIRDDHPEIEIALDEGRVKSPRVAWVDGSRISVRDAEHRSGSRHHDGCAQDILAYEVGGDYITSGDHPFYFDLAEKCKALGLVSGIAWHDANHVSLKAADGRM